MTRSYLKARECKVLQNRLAGVRLYHVDQGRHHLRSRRARGGKIYVREQSPWDYPEEKRGCPPTRLDDFVNHPFLSHLGSDLTCSFQTRSTVSGLSSVKVARTMQHFSCRDATDRYRFIKSSTQRVIPDWENGEDVKKSEKDGHEENGVQIG